MLYYVINIPVSVQFLLLSSLQNKPRVYYMFPFFHAMGENRTSIGRNSSLPAIMSKQKTSLLNGEKPEKFPIGPTSPKPGPIFESVAITDVTDVIKSFPFMDISNVETTNTAEYMKK